MKLEDIGFYTLSDYRVTQSSVMSPLWRCELLLTSRCNFHCPYCKGVNKLLQGDLSFELAMEIATYWLSHGLKNVRMSGGEPTLWDNGDLLKLVSYFKANGVEHIAISTNGSASLEYYEALMAAGVNDFSISLDGGCCSIGENMTGGVKGSWEHTVDIIRELSKQTYVSLGMVFTEENIDECLESVLYADTLGVSDIKVIPSAQYNKALLRLVDLPHILLSKYPILNYRVGNIKRKVAVRGIKNSDAHKCWLVVDDMIVSQGWHFPCVIYLREGGNPIGRVGDMTRLDRVEWANNSDILADTICRNNCLDIYVAHNNKAREIRYT